MDATKFTDEPQVPESPRSAHRAILARAKPRNDQARLRTPKIAKKLAQMPKNVRRTYRRAATGEAWPREAIRAFCIECMGYDDYVKGVRACTDPACPLFLYRPFRPRRM